MYTQTHHANSTQNITQKYLNTHKHINITITKYTKATTPDTQTNTQIHIMREIP